MTDTNVNNNNSMPVDGQYHDNNKFDKNSDLQNKTNKSKEDKKSFNINNDIDSSLLHGENANYWKSRYEKLLEDYYHLQKINQNLEEKLLNVVENFEKKKEELVANIEFEKTTLMADVNKLSTKLVDARIKLHDYEEKELIHASECNAPCHKNCNQTQNNNSHSNKNINVNGHHQMMATKQDNTYDPNLV